MENIKFIVDGCSDIPLSVAKEYDIDITPMMINFGNEAYKDLIEIDAATFYEKQIKAAEPPHTAMCLYEDIYKYMHAAAKEGKKIICVTISSVGSGAFSVYNLVKKEILDEMEATIEIIDSKAYSYIYGAPVLVGCQMARDGKSYEEIIKRIKELIESFEIFFVADTLKYLKKGGRINPAVALIGELLDIKPILSIKEGLVASVDKVRGSKRADARAFQLLKESGYKENGEIFLLSGMPSKERKSGVIDMINGELKPLKIHDVQLGPTVGAHTGPDIWAALYFKDLKEGEFK